MFRFRDTRPVLSDARTASQWFAAVPKHDAFVQQAAVVEAVTALSHGDLDASPAAAEALLVLDELTGTLRRSLVAQYVEVAARPGAVEDRVWHAGFELEQAFLGAYQTISEAADPGRRWASLEPRVILHRVRHLGGDAMYRMFRYEQWIPGKWQQLHGCYARARALHVQARALRVSASASATIEHEYLRIVMLHLLNSGSITAAQIALVADKLTGWISLLQLGVEPAAAQFRIDLDRPESPRRLTGSEPVSTTAHYLDTRRLHAELIQAQSLARRKLASDPLAARTAARMAQLDLLMRLSRQLDPGSSPLTRRGARVRATGTAFVIVGFNRVAATLHEEERRAASGLHAVLEPIRERIRDAARGPDPAGGNARVESARRATYGAGVELWELRDASAAGMRIAAPIADSTPVAIGVLLAVRLDTQSDWSLAAVRRMRRLGADRTELGLQVLSSAVHGVELEAHRGTDAGYSVDGRSVTLSSTRSRALYVARDGRSGAPGHSLIVAPSAHDARQAYTLTTSRSVYTVRLGTVLESQADWVWCGLEILSSPSDEAVSPDV